MLAFYALRSEPTEWAAEHLNDPTVQLVEVDVDTMAYESGHLAGAVGWNWRTDTQDTLRRNLPSREGLQALLAEHVELLGGDRAVRVPEPRGVVLEAHRHRAGLGAGEHEGGADVDLRRAGHVEIDAAVRDVRVFILDQRLDHLDLFGQVMMVMRMRVM